MGAVGSIPRAGRSPGEGKGNPTPVFLPGESCGQRSLAGYSPWGPKESDMTERLSTHLELFTSALSVGANMGNQRPRGPWEGSEQACSRHVAERHAAYRTSGISLRADQGRCPRGEASDRDT